MNKPLTGAGLAAVLALPLLLVPSAPVARAAAPAVTGTETDLGDAIPSKPGSIRSEDSAIGALPNGQTVAAFASTGSAAGTARFYSVDMNGRTLNQITIPRGYNVLAVEYNPSRKSFFFTADDTAAGYLYEWSGGTTLTQRARIAGHGLQSLGTAPNGDVYVGTYKNSDGRVFKFTSSTNGLSDLGQPIAGQSYVRAIAATATGVYTTNYASAPARLARMTTTGGSKTVLPLPSTISAEKSIEDLTVAGTKLFGLTSDSSRLFALDLGTNRAVNFNDQVRRQYVAGGANTETANPVPHLENVSPYTVSPLFEGRYVYVQRAGAGLMRVDLADGLKTIRVDKYWPTDMTRPWAGATVSGPTAFAWLPNVLGRAATSVVATTIDGRLVVNTPGQNAPATATVTATGAPSLIWRMGTGADGSVYAGGYNLPAGIAKHTSGTTAILPGPQVEGFGRFGSDVYMGGYSGSNTSSAPIYRYTGSGSPTLVKYLNNSQERPVVLQQVGSQLAIGSIPVKNTFGGALSLYNPSTGSLVVKRNIVPNQSITALGTHNGLVVGGSSNTGGTGVTPSGSTMPVLFTYNPSTGAMKQVQAPGPSTATYRWVAAITPDPAIPGTFWALSTGQLIQFTVSNAGDIRVTKNYGAYTGGTSSPSGREMGIVISGRTLFVTMSGGLYAVNADSGERVLVAAENASGKVEDLVSPDGGRTLYFSRGTRWYRYAVGSNTIPAPAGFYPLIGAQPARNNLIGEATGDALADVWALDGQGQLDFYAKTSTGLARQGARGSQLSHISYLGAITDQNGDRRADLFYRDRRDQSLRFAYNQGNGYLQDGIKVGQNWGGMDQIFYAGHMVAGSAQQYVLARRASDGTLWRYNLNPSGLSNGTQVGRGWGGMRIMVSPGNMYGDSAWDVVGIRNDGLMFGYKSVNGNLYSMGQIGRGWGSMTNAFAPGDITNDGRLDLIGQRSDGTLWAYRNTATGFAGIGQIGSGFGAYKLMA